MGACGDVVKIPSRRVCAGDLNKRITLHARRIVGPAFGRTEHTHAFEGGVQRWAAVRTIAGKTLFNRVNTDVALTHEIFLRYDSRVTSEAWVELPDGRLLDIEAVENWEEADRFLRLLCVERGPKDQEASQS